jgi:hypothetical protein
MEIFTSIHRIFKTVMAFYKDIRPITADQPVTLPPTVDGNQLSAPELAALLQIVKQATFIGEQVEVVYNMVLKLQNQYIQQTTKK